MLPAFHSSTPPEEKLPNMPITVDSAYGNGVKPTTSMAAPTNLHFVSANHQAMA
ncbi:hypothetical protein ACSS6W_001932 [Trichoderma asperelloides]